MIYSINKRKFKLFFTLLSSALISSAAGISFAYIISYSKTNSIVNAINYFFNSSISSQEMDAFLSVKGILELEKENIVSTSIYKIKDGNLFYDSGTKVEDILPKKLELKGSNLYSVYTSPGTFMNVNVFEQNNIASIILIRDQNFYFIWMFLWSLIFSVLIMLISNYTNSLTTSVGRILRQFTHEVKDDRIVRKMLSSLPALVDKRLLKISKPVVESIDNVFNDIISRYMRHCDFEINFQHEELYVYDISIYPFLGNTLKNSSQHGNDEKIFIETKTDDSYFYLKTRNGLFKPFTEKEKKKILNSKFQDKDGLAIIDSNLSILNGKKKIIISDTHFETQIKIPLKKIRMPPPSSMTCEEMNIKSIAVIDDDDLELVHVWSQVHETLGMSAIRYNHIDDFLSDMEKGKFFDLVITDRFGSYEGSRRSWDVLSELLDIKIREKCENTILILHSKGNYRPNRKHFFDAVVTKDEKNDWSKIIPNYLPAQKSSISK